MKVRYKRQITTLVILTAAVFSIAAGTAIKQEWSSCTNYYNEYFQEGELFFTCVSKTVFDETYQPYTILSLSIFLSLIPLFFLKEKVYFTWRKFAVIATPLIVLWIANSPEFSRGAFPLPLDHRESVTIFSAEAFLIISLLIMIIQSWRLRKRG